MRRTKAGSYIIIGAAVAAIAAACAGQAARPDEALAEQARETFGALPEVMASVDNPLTPEKVALGRMLYYENRISADGTVSCWRCHPLNLYAADGLPKSIGVRCKPSDRNAPTLFNAADQIAQHWIGNRKTVEDQAARSLSGGFGLPDEAAAVARLKAIPGYEPLFRKAFPADPEPVTAANFGRAIGAFERTLVSRAPFDAFLDGQGPGLDDVRQAGLKEFMAAGCSGCHNGPYIGGRSYHKFGLVEPYWKRTLSPAVDEGRFTVTKDEADKFVFKVPVLRNVEMTPPYFHDGSVGRLPDAVWIMGKVQLGLDLATSRVESIVAFLESLTGTLPKSAAEVPLLPGSEAGNTAGPEAKDAAADPPAASAPEAAAGLSPNEDLMQEHALLSRVLLVYEEIGRRVESGGTADPDILRKAALTIQQFIERYHEKLEEEHVFPRFAAPNPLSGLVATLLLQHKAGRALTERILERASAAGQKDRNARQGLLADIRAFIRMYRPHAAREGSLLFPAFRGLLPAKDFLALGDAFESKEHEMLGPAGFEGQVLQVAELEKGLGINDLSGFTPKPRRP